jgi:hypothetical protein
VASIQRTDVYDGDDSSSIYLAVDAITMLILLYTSSIEEDYSSESSVDARMKNLDAVNATGIGTNLSKQFTSLALHRPLESRSLSAAEMLPARNEVTLDLSNAAAHMLSCRRMGELSQAKNACDAIANKMQNNDE